MNDMFRNALNMQHKKRDMENNKKDIPTHDSQTGELNPYYEELTGDKNPYAAEISVYENPNLEECVKMLEDKYKFSLTGDAYAINRLIEFYKKNE